MKNIFCIFFCVLLSQVCFATDAYKKDISFQLKSSLLVPNGSFKTFAETKSNFFNLFSAIETENFSKIKKTKSVSFNVDSFGLRFSPLLVLKQKKYIPCLSFYFGKLNYSSAFNKLISNNFSKPKYGQNISVKSGNLILSKTDFASDFGFQFMLPNFEVNYTASKDKNLNSFHHAIFFGLNGNNLILENHNFLISAYAGFSPTVLQDAYSKKQKYNNVFGFSASYLNEYFALQGSFATSVNLKKEIGLSGSFCFQNFYEYFNIKTGISVSNKKFFGWKNSFPKNSLSFYLAPEFSYDIFTLQVFYNLERSGIKNTQKGIVGKENFYHMAGTKVEIKNKHFKFLTALEYADKTYYLDFITVLYFPKFEFFKKLELKANFDLQEKSKNPYVIQKYQTKLSFVFIPLKEFFVDCGFNFSQENKNKKIKIDGNVTPIIEWQKYKIAGNVKLKYNLKRKKTTNSFSLGIKAFNYQPFYNVSLEYELKL